MIDSAEDCDDAGPWGGDGCTPWCSEETGVLELEPNDEAGTAQDLGDNKLVNGSLPEGDTDCYLIQVPDNGAVLAAVLPRQDTGVCDTEVALELFDDQGDRVLTGLPAINTGCASIDPLIDTYARYLDAGTYSACMSSIFGGVLAAYALQLDTFDSCNELPPLTPAPNQDQDGDTHADPCDPDDDNDRVDDTDDNCPTVPNGPFEPYPWDTSNDGIISMYLVAGPYTTGATPGSCEVSPDHFTGNDDAEAAALLGDPAGDSSWFAQIIRPGTNSVIRFRNYWSPAAPREAYVLSWIYSPEQRPAQLLIGADDGFRTWLNGDVVMDITSCQGVNLDEFTEDISLDAGWNRLMTKVYDQGGGWGVITRIRHPDGANMLDLGLSLGPFDWVDDQGDMDADGVGDVCDQDPANPQ